MSARELTAVALRTLAAWLFASGVAGLFSGLLTWVPDTAQHGLEITAWRLAASSIFIPVGALLWLSTDAAARMAFPESAARGSIGLTRGDLYAFASALVGLFLLSDAATQIVYWIVVWRSSRGTGFWEAPITTSGTMENTVVYWVHVRAQVGLVAAKTLLGAALLFGPERLKTGLLRLRRELSGSLREEEPNETGGSDVSRNGV